MKPLHDWDLDIQSARLLQVRLAARVRLTPLERRPRLVAGADVSVSPGGSLRFVRSRERATVATTPTRVFAAVVVWDVDAARVVETTAQIGETRFPYVPGYLSFREAPTLLAALASLNTRPDVIMLDGQGLAHPRRFGLACHIGLWLNIPTVGCAKSRLIGTHAPLALERGAQSPLVDSGEIVGAVLRTRSNVKPVFVSPGHRIDIVGATRLVLSLATRFRLPEPARLADQLSKRVKSSPAVRI